METRIMSSADDKLEWLEYFYAHAKYGMGPASDDIYLMIKQNYEAQGYFLPEGYGYNEDEDEPIVDEDPSAW